MMGVILVEERDGIDPTKPCAEAKNEEVVGAALEEVTDVEVAAEVTTKEELADVEVTLGEGDEDVTWATLDELGTIIAEVTASVGQAVLVVCWLTVDEVAVAPEDITLVPQASLIASSKALAGSAFFTTAPHGSVPIIAPDQPQRDLQTSTQLAARKCLFAHAGPASPAGMLDSARHTERYKESRAMPQLKQKRKDRKG